jgi:hypothetical protein
MVDARFTVYYRRAEQFADAMKLCQDDLSAYASAAGLLAVHSAIAYSDALLIRLTGTRPHGKNHRDAVPALKRACTGAKIAPDGIKHLEKLLSVKADISYGDKQVDDERGAALCSKAERFQTWAKEILRNRQVEVMS